MRYPKLRELVEAIKAIITGPYCAKFPKKPAICSPNYRGRPTYDDSTCMGCATCAKVCPTGAISFEDPGKKDDVYRTFTLDLGQCIFCGECQRNCPVLTGITLHPVWDLAVLNRTELISKMQKEVLFCTNCGSVIAPIAQLRYLFRTLGSAAFSNPTLILSISEHVKELRQQKTPVIKHHDIFNVLCPRCRHKILVNDTYGEELKHQQQPKK